MVQESKGRAFGISSLIEDFPPQEETSGEGGAGRRKGLKGKQGEDAKHGRKHSVFVGAKITTRIHAVPEKV